MKVAFINALYAPHEIGGAERAVKVIAEELVRVGGESVVITLAPDGVRKTSTINGVRVHYLPLSNLGFLHGPVPLAKWRRVPWHVVDAYNPTMGRRVQQVLAEERPDVVEANNLQGFSVAAWTAASRERLPLVQVLHDYYLACRNSTMYRNGKNCERQCRDCGLLSVARRRYSKLPQVVSSVSERTLQRIQQAGVLSGQERTFVAPTGIVMSAANVSSTLAQRAAGEPLTIGFLGRLEPIKGVELLLQAARSLGEKVRVLVAGGGEHHYVSALKARFASPQVEFLGVVQPSELFARIQLLVVPSLWEEPLGRVIAEAHASGVLVAVARLGGMPEIIEEGVTGYVFAANEVATLATLLARLAAQKIPSDEQVAACRARTDIYTVESVFRHHRELWSVARERAATS
jgi:glycosyltransferase involved in cell wall biosynthesis